MAHIEWGDGVYLGTVQGDIVFTPSPPAPSGEPIQIPPAISISVNLAIPDESPIYRWPPILAANAPNN